jgi:hypothetical protein
VRRATAIRSAMATVARRLSKKVADFALEIPCADSAVSIIVKSF